MIACLFRRMAAAAALLVFAALPALADNSSPQQQAWDAAVKAALQGPRDIPFTDEAVLKLPEGMAYIPVAEASALMRAWGNSAGDQFRGLVVPVNDDNWAVSIDQIADGYVKDEEAKQWNADDLLKSLKEGTEAQNAERKSRGLPELDITGWVELPRYDDGAHRLIWSLKAVDRGAPAGGEATVNYNTYALGRDGYFEINLMTGSNHIDADKAKVQRILSSFNYNPGKRYEDFVPETDHVAEYGIAALVAGVAAKKLGLLAIAGVFFAKFAKVILIGFAVVGGAIAKFFKRGSPSA